MRIAKTPESAQSQPHSPIPSHSGPDVSPIFVVVVILGGGGGAGGRGTYESIFITVTQEPVHVFILHHVVRQVQDGEVKTAISSFIEYDLTYPGSQLQTPMKLQSSSSSGSS